MERNYLLKQKLHFEKLGGDEDVPDLIHVTVTINSNHVLDSDVIASLEEHYSNSDVLGNYGSVEIVRGKVLRE